MAIQETFNVTLTDHEMFLVLNGLEKKAETTSEEKSKEYQALYERLTDIYEDRV